MEINGCKKSKPSLDEYMMLRTEILQYLEEYQTVRNMMYVVTGAILAFCFDSEEIYLFLLPLIVIIPSYMIAIEYRNSVNKAASYLKVYYEENNIEFPIKWETKQQELKELFLNNKGNSDLQFLPYKLLAVACIALYFIKFVEYNIATWASFLNTNFVDVGVLIIQIFQILFGVVSCLICEYIL